MSKFNVVFWGLMLALAAALFDHFFIPKGFY